MRELADRYRDQLKSDGVIGLGGETADGKALIIVNFYGISRVVLAAA